MNRTKQILELLAAQPFASVNDLQVALDVSAATIRRDIDRMDADGIARKVYGGIAALDGVRAKPLPARPYLENIEVAVEAKTQIAMRAAQMVQDGDRVIISPGTTCCLLGTQLAKRNISIYTNSMPLAGYLGEHGTCSYTVGGGEAFRAPGLYHRTHVQPHPYYASKLFLSGQGCSARGLLESHPIIADITGHFVAWVDEVIALIDSRKFNIDARYSSLGLSRIDRLITDEGLSDKDAKCLEDEGVDFIIASATEVKG